MPEDLLAQRELPARPCPVSLLLGHTYQFSRGSSRKAGSTSLFACGQEQHLQHVAGHLKPVLILDRNSGGKELRIRAHFDLKCLGIHCNSRDWCPRFHQNLHLVQYLPFALGNRSFQLQLDTVEPSLL